MSLILAVVGSTCAHAREAKPLIREAIWTYQPTMLVSGGASGVDTWAEEVAEEMALPFTVILPEVERWDGGERIGFKQRNMQIAEMCDRILAIRSHRSTSFGSGWTYHYATRDLGKPGALVMVS